MIYGIIFILVILLGIFGIKRIMDKKTIEKNIRTLHEFCAFSIGDNRKFCTDSLSDKPVIILFMDPDCDFCQEEIKQIKEDQTQFKDASILLVTCASLQHQRNRLSGNRFVGSVSIFRKTAFYTPKLTKSLKTIQSPVILHIIKNQRMEHYAVCFGYENNCFIIGDPGGEDGIHISGGQRQLIALAWALYRRPSLLLLDEPTSAMDGQTERFVINLLKERANQFAVFMVTHRIYLADLSTRVYRLENGTTVLL